MRTPSALVVHAGTHGHTAKIAARIVERLRAAGAEVRTVDLLDPAPYDPAAFDLVVVGGSIHAGRHQQVLSHWLRRHRESLAARPVALFSVSLTAADESAEAQEAATGYIDALLADTGLRPGLTLPVAGALRPREYPAAIRVLARLVARSRGLPADPSGGDVEYTDWSAVDAFADGALELAGVPVAGARAA